MDQQPQQPVFPRQGSNYEPLPRGNENGRVISHAVQTIRDASPEQVFHAYTRPELLPVWQEGVVSVVATGDRTQHWTMQDPGTGKHFEFDSEIVENLPNERYTTRVTSGPFESTTESAIFRQDPNGRGTVVTLISDYKVPGGVIAKAVSALVSRTPEQLTIENLRHLKQLIESHEIPSVEGQPAGPRGVIGRWKQWMMGETLPVPPGTSDRARPQDLPAQDKSPRTPLLVGTVVAAAGIVAWLGVRRLR